MKTCANCWSGSHTYYDCPTLSAADRVKYRIGTISAWIGILILLVGVAFLGFYFWKALALIVEKGIA